MGLVTAETQFAWRHLLLIFVDYDRYYNYYYLMDVDRVYTFFKRGSIHLKKNK